MKRHCWLWELVKIVTSFTVAHTMTLVLATLANWQLPGRLVETAIAATIIYVAVENFWIDDDARRWPLTVDRSAAAACELARRRPSYRAAQRRVFALLRRQSDTGRQRIAIDVSTHRQQSFVVENRNRFETALEESTPIMRANSTIAEVEISA